LSAVGTAACRIIHAMAESYTNANSPDLHSTKMRDGILRGLAFWYNRKPAADNWWSNEIGQQLTLEPILMADDLPPKLLQVGTTYLHDPVELASYKFTGQNVVWCATEQFIRGILRRSADDIASTALPSSSRHRLLEARWSSMSRSHMGANRRPLRLMCAAARRSAPVR
jgi:hypothetical protein